MPTPKPQPQQPPENEQGLFGGIRRMRRKYNEFLDALNPDKGKERQKRLDQAKPKKGG